MSVRLYLHAGSCSDALILQAAKSNKKESRQLALRADAILEAIETTVRDPRHLDSDLKARIESFTQ